MLILIRRQYRSKDADGKDVDSVGEVQYYFKVTVEEKVFAYALIKEYSTHDTELLEKSTRTLWSRRRLDTLKVIDATDIVAVVGAVPHPNADGRLGSYDGQVFIMEKMGLDVMTLLETPAEDGDDEDRRQEEEFAHT